MAASSGSAPPRVPRRWLSGGVVLAVSACMPSRSLDDYGRDHGRAGNAGTTSAGSGGASGAAGSAGAAGSGGQSAPEPVPGARDAGASADAGAAPGDAGAVIRLDGGASAALCAAGEQLGPDERCYFFDATLASWATARAACQARGAGWDLARVRLAEQSVFLGETLAFEAWIGATDAASEGQWLWVGDAAPFWIGNGATGSANAGAFTNWNPTEPNGATATNCARALPRSIAGPASNAPWADLDCALQLGAICESGPLP
jgi:lectin-like protein